MGEHGHDPLGPSGLDRVFGCSGSPSLISQCPTIPSGRDALVGTAVHWLIEQIMKSELGLQPYVYYANKSIELEGKEIKITTEMLDNAEYAVRYIRDRMKQYATPTCSIEQKITVIKASETTFNRDITGSLDYGIHVPYHGLIVIDYKNGYHKVSALGNKQLLAYALGLYNTLSPLAQAELQWVELVIVQKQNVETWMIEVDYLVNTFKPNLIAAIDATNIENAPQLTVGDWCKWCPAQLRCAAWDAAQNEALKVTFKALPSVIEIQKTLPKPQDITPVQLYSILRSHKTFDNFFDQAKQYALGIMESGTEEQKAEFRAAGFSLKESLGDREWINPDTVVETVKLAIGERYAGDTFETPPQILSPAKMETRLKDVYNISKKQFESIGLTKRESKGYMLKFD